MRTSKKDTSLLGMRSDSDWLLLAMYNEPLRANNTTAQALWRQMHSLYYQSQEPSARASIQMRYVDVFVNGSYEGIYALTEDMDRKQLQLKKTASNGQIRGELYKGSDYTSATLFTGVPNDVPTRESWAGFELKYPNDTTLYSNLQNLLAFASTSDPQTFSAQIGQRMKLENLADYFLFINVIRATDNMGKNMFVARYKENDPYILVPWDLDGTFGYLWDGSRLPPVDQLYSNGLFNRLIYDETSDFRKHVKQRYFSLRTSLFTNNSLKKILTTSVTQLRADGAYRREALRWPVGNNSDELTYAHDFIDRRLAYLDSLLGTFLDYCANPPVPTVAVSGTLITKGTVSTLTATGCAYTVVWNSGEVGASLQVTPARSFSYSAKCYQDGANCSSIYSAPVSISVLPETDTINVANLSLEAFSEQRVYADNVPVKLMLRINNAGPKTAHAVKVQHRLPRGLTLLNPTSTLNSVDGIINMLIDSVSANGVQLISYSLRPAFNAQFSNAIQILESAEHDSDSTPGSGTGDGENDMALVDFRSINGGDFLQSPNPNQSPLPTVLSNQPPPPLDAADLRLDIISDKILLTPDQPISLTVQVSNAGSLTATGVMLRGTLPPETTFVWGEGIEVQDGQLKTTMPLLIEPGKTIRLVLQLQILQLGDLISKWQISVADQPDPDSIPDNGFDTGEDDTAVLSWRVR